MAYKIYKTIPPPPPKRTYNFDKLEVGDSILVPDGGDALRVAASTYGTRHNKKFTIRIEKGGLRCWRVK